MGISYDLGYLRKVGISAKIHMFGHFSTVIRILENSGFRLSAFTLYIALTYHGKF